MPTRRHGWVYRALRDKRAVIARHKPFTVQLTYETSDCTQDITLGIDGGYGKVGYSAVASQRELLGGELTLLKGQSERLRERAQYRKTRRNHLRYRKPGFLKDTKPEGWLAPSIEHKLDSHIRLIGLIQSVLPISKVVVEVANFDIQKINNPTIKGDDYQHGVQYGFDNVRDYVLHRDGHTCQNPDCKHKTKILRIHHLGYWHGDSRDHPANLITLCKNCHTPANHQVGGLLHGWKPELPNFKGATFMSSVRWKMVNIMDAGHTYGYITKARRRILNLEKSHHNDAFVIAGGTTQKRYPGVNLEQIRRNNRCLQTFVDAKYLDTRDHTIQPGKTLFSGRTTRNRGLNTENLRVYRGHKIRNGLRRVRRQRYRYQRADMVLLAGKPYKCQGMQNKGAYIRLSCRPKDKVVNTSLVSPLEYRKGICYAS